jgi:serine/threonine-protein kinase SRPK3
MTKDQSQRKAFLAELKAIDPEVLATAMGGNKPPEEPLLKTFEEGYGYFTGAAVNRHLKHYQFVRKVSVCEASLNQIFDRSVQLGWASSSSVWLVV